MPDAAVAAERRVIPDFGAGSELVQRPQGIRPETQGGSPDVELRGPFEDGDVEPPAMKADGGRQSPDAGSGYDGFHVLVDADLVMRVARWLELERRVFDVEVPDEAVL